MSHTFMFIYVNTHEHICKYTVTHITSTYAFIHMY